MFYTTRTYTVCGHVRASFSWGILEARAVKGLIMITLGSRITLSQMSPRRVRFILKLKQVTSKHAA